MENLGLLGAPLGQSAMVSVAKDCAQVMPSKRAAAVG